MPAGAVLWFELPVRKPRDVTLELFRLTNGLPRTVNRLAYHCLMAAALEGKDLVDQSCLDRAVSEVLPADLN